MSSGVIFAIVIVVVFIAGFIILRINKPKKSSKVGGSSGIINEPIRKESEFENQSN